MMRWLFIILSGFVVVSCASQVKVTIDQQLDERARLFPRNPAAPISRINARLPTPSTAWKAPKKKKR